MIGLGQADWFIDKLAFRYPELERGEDLWKIINALEPDYYHRLKKLFYEGFASGGGKRENPVAQQKLRELLIELGVKFHERVTKI